MLKALLTIDSQQVAKKTLIYLYSSYIQDSNESIIEAYKMPIDNVT